VARRQREGSPAQFSPPRHAPRFLLKPPQSRPPWGKGSHALLHATRETATAAIRRGTAASIARCSLLLRRNRHAAMRIHALKI